MIADILLLLGGTCSLSVRSDTGLLPAGLCQGEGLPLCVLCDPVNLVLCFLFAAINWQKGNTQ